MGILRWVGGGAAGLGLVGAGYLGAAGQDATVRDEAGHVVEGGELGAFRIRLGDCLELGDQTEVETVQGVPCADPHEAEVYFAFELADGPWPGDDQVLDQAERGCFDAFEPFVGLAYVDSVYGYSALSPSRSSWEELEDREVLCLIAHYDGTPKQGSAHHTAR